MKYHFWNNCTKKIEQPLCASAMLLFDIIPDKNQQLQQQRKWETQTHLTTFEMYFVLKIYG